MGPAVNLRMTLNTRETETAVQRLKAKAPIAIARALNRSAASGKTIMVRVLADDLGVKQKDIRDKVIVVRATPEQHVASLRASAKRIPVYDMGARGPFPSRARGRGVTWRNQGQRKRDRSAFIARVGTGGHMGVFKRLKPTRSRAGLRRGSPGLPIDELFGPSIAHAFTNRVGEAQARMREVLTKNLQHELQFALSRR